MADNDKRAGGSLARARGEKRRRRDERDEQEAAQAAAAERSRIMRAVTAVVVVLGVAAAGLAHSYVPETRQPIHMPPRVDWKTHCEDLRERGLFIRYYRMGEAEFEKLASLLRPWIERDDAYAQKTWCALIEAGSMMGKCASEECIGGVHFHTDFADLKDEMSQIEGAVVKQRPNLCGSNGIWPSKDLDFVKTLRSYFPLFEHSLLARDILEPEVQRLNRNFRIGRFLDAVSEGNDTAGLYLSAYYGLPEVPIQQSTACGYEAIPTISAMANVFIMRDGYVFNTKDWIIPKSCTRELSAHDKVPEPASLASHWSGYAEVLILTQHWGGGYYHFLIECLPRITLMLDVLHTFPDIKMAIGPDKEDSGEYREQLLGLLGFGPKRIILDKHIHADIAFLPESTPCGFSNTLLISRLRFILLKGLYPETGGVAPSPPRPVIVLMVRKKKRWLKNSDEVREALIENFPNCDVVEFYGDGTMHEQLKVFAEASLLIGPHGAGFSNMIVSPLHTMVLEIGPPGCSFCYVHLALKLQHIYARHIGRPWSGGDCYGDFVPDIGELMAIIRDLQRAKAMADEADPPIPPLESVYPLEP